MISREIAIATLKRVWRTNDLIFLGKFIIPRKQNGQFINPHRGKFQDFLVNDREIFYPKDETLKYNRKVFFNGNVISGLEDGRFYNVELELEDDENRKTNPYALKIKNVYIREDDHTSPEDFIRQWFYKKGHTPSDAATIAGQLTLNELELYTHTKRFIFELIQNADDMPDGNKPVNIEINLLKNHLLFLHNGKFFDREDVSAIADAAKSTKTKGQTQTGYKGIGFKSVFTDSTRVYINSGAYHFKFDKLEPIYNDFYKLYKGYSDSLNTNARKEFNNEFKGRELEFTNIDKIPWQIKPIWVEQNSLNNELKTSNFLSNYQVAIALEIGENILRQKNYNGMIIGLLKEPRFLLFLRNTKQFKYINQNIDSEKIIDISVKEDFNNLGVYNNKELIASYLKDEFEIKIDNDDFLKAGLNFNKREIEGGKIEFFDSEGNKLENIPEKLGRLDKTIISLAAKINKTQIEKLDKEDSILFNYLPTSDQRFGFPFLVNADFVSKTDREFIQIENKWNHYIFYHLGRICIEWIAKLGSVRNVNNGKTFYTYSKSYLNLLPESLLDEENEELASINIAFNKGLNDALENVSFIIGAKGQLKKCDEIIIDETSISEILGIKFFAQVSNSKKELPFISLNKSIIKRNYLNIERYNADQLYEALEEESNIDSLKIILDKANDDQYLSFLNWLDNFCKKNDTGADWISDLPFIRIDKTVLSLNEALIIDNFLFKTSKTIDIESLLKKTGFILSDFYIDVEDYKHIYAAILQQDTYLNNEVKLYEHIASAKELDKLIPVEKNKLLSFLEALHQVEISKYAESLLLFKSKRKENPLKPLASLISNTCQNLPNWLSDFVIDELEEKALSETFKNLLIKQDELLEKVFCNSAMFNELINNIDHSNIEVFYNYILKLHKEIPEDADDIDYKQVPWFYLQDNNLFAMPSTVYFPDSLTKLSLDKYLNVKTIIETLSSEKLPIYASLVLKKIFGLGCKGSNLKDLLTEIVAFEVLAINDFLDWVQFEGEKEFFSQFTISKDIDKYSISPTEDIVQYYSNNNDLISFIENSDLKSKLMLLPIEVHSTERTKIGLLEGIELLKYIIEELTVLNTLAKFVQEQNDAQLSQIYIGKIGSLDIDSSKNYDKTTDVFKILEIITQTAEIIDDEDKIKVFRKKIFIDTSPLSEKAISDDIRFYENKTLKIELNTKLTEVLKSYVDKTYSITAIVEKFTNFKNKGLAKIFKAQSLSAKKIYNQLIELKPVYYNPTQTFFLSYFQFLNPEIDVFDNTVLFSINQDKDSTLFDKEIKEFLDISLKENKYIEFVEQEIIPDFTPTSYLLEDEFSIESEKPPLWLSDWITTENNDNKIEFIKLLGVNTLESPVVVLRKAILESVSDMDAARGNLVDVILFKNTFEWIKLKNKIKLSEDLLKPLYARAYSLKIPVIDLPIAILLDTTETNFKLVEHKEENKYHIIHQGWGEQKILVFDHLSKNDIYTINSILPQSFVDDLSGQKYDVEGVLDSDLINKNSIDFEDNYYQSWEDKDSFPIKIYKGSKLPYRLIYNEEMIKSFEYDTSEIIDGTLYVSEDIKNSIPESIKDKMEPKLFNSLYYHKSEFLKNEKKVIEYNSKELDALKRIFDENLPDDYQKNYNLAACIAALVKLEEIGYNVDEAVENLKKSHVYAQLEPVYIDANQENSLTVMCRSSILGLLYLTLGAWNRLDKENIILYAHFGNSGGELYKNKQEVLDTNEKTTDYQIIRIESEANASLIDSLFNKELSKIDEEKITIIFRVKENKNYDALFYKDYQPDNDYVNNNITTRTDDNSGGY